MTNTQGYLDAARRLLDGATCEELANLRSSMIWGKDKPIRNPFGEWMYLKDAMDEQGNVIGVTECCPRDAPCDIHAQPPAEPGKETR